MTILTKPSLNIKKTPLIHVNNCDEEVIEIHQAPTWTPAKRSSAAVVCISITALLVAITGITSGLMLYRQYLRGNAVHHYKGFCSIPISTKMDPQLIEPNYRVMPLRWSPVPDMQVFSALDDDTSDDLVNALREEFDIDPTVEKISVFDNGRQVNFIHDFETNVTGIVDDDRCFMMGLDLDSVLPPESLAEGMQGGEEFDVSRVHTTLHAVLPALRDMAYVASMLVERCGSKPIYKLEKEEGLVIRKRSLDAPQHDYMQFAGKHVQEIEIANMNDLLYHEQLERNATHH
ncbi:hypothetical protein K1T71_002894 [Dendrolimus kikuchii]|uniref:Uncharacterized protein n=1 Tax=Dendrolimus kikuchii TaxID=765133 RepID=A0ACC1DEZ7_9NEOP|nr:hypothetical protein K1T71_002894 [Dendrolimus kikuchii]